MDMVWTDNQVTALKALWQEGLSASQVAKQLGGISRGAVIGKIHRLGVAGRPVPVRIRARSARSQDRTRRPSLPGEPAFTGLPARVTAFRAIDAAIQTPTATIQTLGRGCCRWPIGDPRDPGFGYCGRTRADRGSYCWGHAQAAFRHRRQTSQQPDQALAPRLTRPCSSIGAE